MKIEFKRLAKTILRDVAIAQIVDIVKAVIEKAFKFFF